MLEICGEVGASTYISGISGKEYLDRAKFAKKNINLEFHQFHHPVYRQVYAPFIPCMSVIDLLFNYGPDGLNVLKGVGVKTMDHVFE